MKGEEMNEATKTLKFNDQGLIPAIAQNAETGEVLMLAWMNAEALEKTIETGEAHYWSRSRGKLWMKGETSGHTQQVKAVYVDCDQDALVVEVVQRGAACHEGYRSCFYRRLGEDGDWQVIAEKVFDPKDVYGKGP